MYSGIPRTACTVQSLCVTSRLRARDHSRAFLGICVGPKFSRTKFPSDAAGFSRRDESRHLVNARYIEETYLRFAQQRDVIVVTPSCLLTVFAQLGGILEA